MKTISLTIGTLLLTQAATLAATIGTISDNTFFSLPTVNVGTNMASLKTDLTSSGLARTTVGNQTIFIGSQQVSANNQNPFAISFQNDTVQWFVDDYETGGPDGRGVGLVWDGGSGFYGAFIITGGGSGIESLASNGWLSSFGNGGNKNVTVLARLDATTGEQGATFGGMGTFVSSVLSNGSTNSLGPTALSLDDAGNVILQGNAFFGPRGINTTRMDEVDTSGGSPFNYLAVFDADLGDAQGACAEGWDDPNTSSEFCASFGFAADAVPEVQPSAAFGVLVLGGLTWMKRRSKRFS